jgi:hypothetical protein
MTLAPDARTGTGLASVVGLLLSRHGAPDASAPVALWSLRHGVARDAASEFFSHPVAGFDDVIAALARCELGREDRMLALLWRTQSSTTRCRRLSPHLRRTRTC